MVYWSDYKSEWSAKLMDDIREKFSLYIQYLFLYINSVSEFVNNE